MASSEATATLEPSPTHSTSPTWWLHRISALQQVPTICRQVESSTAVAGPLLGAAATAALGGAAGRLSLLSNPQCLLPEDGNDMSPSLADFPVQVSMGPAGPADALRGSLVATCGGIVVPTALLCAVSFVVSYCHTYVSPAVKPLQIPSVRSLSLQCHRVVAEFLASMLSYFAGPFTRAGVMLLAYDVAPLGKGVGVAALFFALLFFVLMLAVTQRLPHIDISRLTFADSSRKFEYSGSPFVETFGCCCSTCRDPSIRWHRLAYCIDLALSTFLGILSATRVRSSSGCLLVLVAALLLCIAGAVFALVFRPFAGSQENIFFVANMVSSVVVAAAGLYFFLAQGGGDVTAAFVLALLSSGCTLLYFVELGIASIFHLLSRMRRKLPCEVVVKVEVFHVNVNQWGAVDVQERLLPSEGVENDVEMFNDSVKELEELEGLDNPLNGDSNQQISVS